MIEKPSLLALVGCLLAAAANAVEPDDILGAWITSGGQSFVKVSREGDEYIGHIIRLQEPSYRPGEVEGRVRLEETDLRVERSPLVSAGAQEVAEAFRGVHCRDPSLLAPAAIEAFFKTQSFPIS